MSDLAKEVSRQESGILRLYALDNGAPDGAALHDALRDETPDAGEKAAAALGVDHVDPWWVTLIRQADLSGMGLTTYLSEGHDIPDDQISRAAKDLEDAGPHLILVHSPAFGGAAVSLTPAAFLRPVATFDTRRAQAPARPTPHAAPDTHGDEAAPDDTSADKRGSAGRSAVVAVAIIGAALLVALAAFMVG